jgi:hypothetical protein
LQINVGRVVTVYEMNLLEDDVGLEVLVLEQTAGEEGGHQQIWRNGDDQACACEGSVR